MNNKTFADLPLSSKLQRVQAVAVGLALLITLLVGILTDIWTEQRNTKVDIQTTGKMIGFNAGIALMFNDRKSATDILTALANKSAIIAARLYRNDGMRLASYPADLRDIHLPESLAEAETVQRPHFFSASQQMLLSIDQDGEVVGHLLLVADLRPMWREICEKFGLISLVMLLAFSVTLAFGRRLAALISEPIINLSAISQQMSREKNYSLRAQGEGADEIGRLVKSFNLMMAQIQERDEKLERHRAQLEQDVQARTVDLRQALLEAQAASTAKSQFLANMSHEIRTPMNGVIGMVDVLFNTELSNEQKNMVQVIRDSAYIQLDMLNDVLDFSKIEAGKMVLSISPLSVRDVIDDLCSLLDKQAQQKQIQLVHSIDPLIPKVLEGDILRLRQILNNLIANAIKFSSGLKRQGRVSVDVRLVKQKKDSVWIEVVIQDNGIGMNQETKSRLFQSFEQGDISTTRRYGGTGLGLVISRRLADIMGGRIEVESTSDVGSMFSLHLPFKRVNGGVQPVLSTNWRTERFEVASIAPALNREQALQQGRLILVAEDNETNQDVIRQQLTMLGYMADVANNGREALELWFKGRYNLLLTDIHMPYMDGYQLTTAIRDEEAKTGSGRMPIIALTAVALRGEDERCKKIGMDDYISKPAPLPAMKVMLDKWLPTASALQRSMEAASEQELQNQVENEAEHVVPLWDHGALCSLVGNDWIMQRRLLEKFLHQADEKAVTLAAMVEAGDSARVDSMAHAFKSAARTVGAMQLGELCFSLEKAAKAGDLAACKMLSAQLGEQLRVVGRAIQQKLAEAEQS